MSFFSNDGYLPLIARRRPVFFRCSTSSLVNLCQFFSPTPPEIGIVQTRSSFFHKAIEWQPFTRKLLSNIANIVKYCLVADNFNQHIACAHCAVYGGRMYLQIVNLICIVKIDRWVEEFLKNRTFRVKLGGHLSSEGFVERSDYFVPSLGNEKVGKVYSHPL